MTDTEMETLIATSFLARVPALMVGGMSLEDAIVEAKRQDDALCKRMQDALYNQGDEYYAAEHEVIHTLAADVYAEFNKAPAVPTVNIRRQIYLDLQTKQPYFIWVDECMAEYSKVAGIAYTGRFTSQQHADFDAWLQKKYQ